MCSVATEIACRPAVARDRPSARGKLENPDRSVNAYRHECLTVNQEPLRVVHHELFEPFVRLSCNASNVRRQRNLLLRAKTVLQKSVSSAYRAKLFPHHLYQLFRDSRFELVDVETGREQVTGL